MTAPIFTDVQVIAQLNSGYRWSGSTITYAFPTTYAGMYYSTENQGFIAATPTQQALFKIALQSWDDLISPNFQEVASGSSGSTYSTSNIDIAYSTVGVSYAHAYYPTVGSAWFNAAYASGINNLVSPSIDDYGYQVFIHEFGHSLGLNHMGDYNGSGDWTPSSYQDTEVYSVMSYFGPNGPLYSTEVASADWTGSDGQVYFPQTPMLNDVMAIQQIYGASTTTRIDDTVYGFSCNITSNMAGVFDFTTNLHPILTIFDSGGIDTLNLSGWSTASQIYLQAGAFSSANSMTNNLCIARSVVIENAVGGSGNDGLTGNAVGNLLDGGAGNDVISGLEGGDTLIGGGGNDQCFGGAGTDTAILPDFLASYAISYDSLTGLLTVSGASSGSDTFSEVEYFQFSDGLRSLEQLLGADLAAPTLNSTNPTDNATGVAVNTNLVFTFNEAVQAGSGNIYIYNSDDTVARSIAVNDTTQINIVGNTVTINPSVDLANGSSFYIRLDSGVITDFVGNNFDGINDSSSLNFSTISASNLTLTGTSGANTLTGGAGNDTLNGLAGNDTLNGLAGNDILNGGAGTDSMNGGDGSDIYLISQATEHPVAEIADSGSSGTDEVRFTSTAKGAATLTLYAGDTGIEQIVIGTGTGTMAVTTSTRTLNVNATSVNNGLSIIGNAGSNSMTGTAFADILNGGAGADILISGAGADILIGSNGKDILTGGAGADYFVFNFAANTANNKDTLTDFLSGTDTLQFSKAIFTTLGSIGNLAAVEFRSGAGVTSGGNADDHIVYNTTTGVLYYDADGSGAGAAVQVALLGTTTHPALAYTDIQIIA